MSTLGGCACCDAAGYAESADWPADVSRLLYERLAALGFAGRSVLEIGCGYGRLLVGALVAGARLGTGVELDPEALEAARERAEEAAWPRAARSWRETARRLSCRGTTSSCWTG